MKTDSGPPYFLIVSWIAFGLVSWLWIATRSSAEEKRLWHRRFIIVAGILFGAFISFSLVSWGQSQALLIFLPAIVLIGYLNIRFTFFCDACGKTIFSQALFSSGHYCSNCGNKLR
jgi:hypothetical protein